MVGCLLFTLEYNSYGQNLLNSANPISNLLIEHSLASKNKFYPINIIRPSIKNNHKSFFKVQISNISYNNSGFSNIHNNSEIIAHPGISNYLSYSMTYFSKNIYVKFSPILSNKGNLEQEKSLGQSFDYLNDKNGFGLKNHNFLNQSSFALHYKGIGAGVSNESMWFGPGFHSSLSMSNNAPGFNHYFIGTLRQYRFGQFGFNFRYFISERNNNKSNFYHTALASSMTYYSNPTITLGFNRTYLSGGVDKIIWTMEDAAKLVFEPLFGSSKTDLTYTGQYEGEPDYWDPWDQLTVGFVNVYFPTSKTHYYFELGTDDSRANLTDLKAHWDHAIGYILGFKKYGIMGNQSIFIGLEIMSTKTTSNTLNQKFYRGSFRIPNFYGNSSYLHSSYGGRRWAAHSGSDSDDKIIMIGYVKNDLFIISSYNLERRGIVSQENPEYKNEIILSFRKQINKISYSLYFENEKIYNYNFNQNDIPHISNVIGLGIHYNLDFD